MKVSLEILITMDVMEKKLDFIPDSILLESRGRQCDVDNLLLLFNIKLKLQMNPHNSGGIKNVVRTLFKKLSSPN
jgi:hypothetical protein